MESIKLVVVLLEGLLSFFSPCILPVLPIYLSLLSNSMSRESFTKSILLRNTMSFVFGISTTFFILGVSIRTLSKLFNQYQSIFLSLGGVVIIIMGLFYMGLIRIPFLYQEKRLQINAKQMGVFSAYLLGFTFSFGWTPCVGPMLTSVLMMTMGSENVVQGNLLLLLYTLGFTVPFMGIAFFYHRLTVVIGFMKNHLHQIKLMGGVLLILSGGYMVFNRDVPFIQSKSPTVTMPQQSPDESSSPDQEVIKAPDFTLNDQYGQEYMLSQYQGKVIFLTFFATWCRNCEQELPAIQKLYQEYGSNQEDLVMLSVASPNVGREGDEEWVKNYLGSEGFTFPVLMDEGGSVPSRYGIRAVPSTFVINKKGHLLYYIPGAIGEDAMRNLIELTRFES